MMSKFIYTDTDGTVPAVWGDSVARIDDQSPNGRNAVQANVAFRPKLGRAPVMGRRNLFDADTKSLVPNQSLSNLSVEQGAGPDGEDRLVTYDGSGVVTYIRFSNRADGVENTVSFEIKPDGAPYVAIGFTNAASANVGFDLSSGTVYSPPSTGAASIEALPDGWFRCVWTYAGAGTIVFVWCSTTQVPPDGNSTSVTGDGVAGVLIRSRQQELGDAATPHQRVAAAGLDITEPNVPSPAFIRPDLSDDVLPTTFPDGFTGDVLVCGRKGSWIERDVTIAAGGTFNLGPTTITGGPVGLLAALGDIVGYLPVGKTISATELSRLMSYFKARGARPLLDAGDL